MSIIISMIFASSKKKVLLERLESLGYLIDPDIILITTHAAT